MPKTDATDMAVGMAASESPTTIVGDGFDLAIHSGNLPDSTLVARRFAQTMIIFAATPQYLTRYGAPELPEDFSRFRSVVFVEQGSYSRGALAPDKTRSALTSQGSFEEAILNRWGWVSLKRRSCSYLD